jgi:lipopolysaccharide transport system ATP-binding protein
MSVVLEVVNVSKIFRSYGGEWRRVLSWFGLPFVAKDEFQALDNISFKAQAGESIGIIGHNGAGKSTLLKLITGTLKPTSGNIMVNGHVAAILELGMGFHPDLTGRQNARHAASLMGHSQETIAASMEEIEAFSDIGKHFDHPVRTYSSGMQMRVAFSVATTFRPDLLIVDEALSVGDEYFKHKCFDRFRELKQYGTTLLFASHDKEAIQSLCEKAILLNRKNIEMEAAPDVVMDYYSALLAEQQKGHSISQKRIHNGKPSTISGTGDAKVLRIALLNSTGEEVTCVEVGEPVCLEIEVSTYCEIPRLVMGFLIKDRLGNSVYGTNTYHADKMLHNLAPGKTIRFHFRFSMNIGIGAYSISTAIVDSDSRYSKNYECTDLALSFQVVNGSKQEFVGVSWLDASIEIEQVTPERY